MTNTAAATTKSTEPQNGDILIHKDGSTYRIYRLAGDKLNEIATCTTYNRQRGISVQSNGLSAWLEASDFTKRQIEKQGRSLVEKYVSAAKFAADIWTNLHMSWADKVWDRLD